MICFVATASTNNNNQARRASTGDMLSARVRSAAASFFHLGPVNRDEQVLTRGKVSIQSPRSDTRFLGDILQACVRAGAGELLFCCFQDACAVPLRVRARGLRSVI